jgi:hypothetical protein
MEELVQKYIELRDAKSQLKAKYDAKAGKLDTAMEKIEAILLMDFNERGIESMRTAAGTAYKQTRVSAGVADWDAARDFIVENELWNMLERRVNKSAIEQYKEANGDLPPGINWREEVVINVRRSA